jgi:chromosome segregation ATPase
VRDAHASSQTDLANLRLEQERLTREQAEIQNQATQQRAELQTQLARATDDLTARNREIAELEGRLQTTRQALADAQSQLAEARQQLATPPISGNTSGAGTPTEAAPMPPETAQR